MRKQIIILLFLVTLAVMDCKYSHKYRYKSKLRHKKKGKQFQITNIATMRAKFLHPTYYGTGDNLTHFEKAPWKYQMLNPMDLNTSERIITDKIYSKDTKPYYSQDPVDKDTLLKGDEKFDDDVPENELRHHGDNQRRVYKKDEVPYYDPVQSEKNLWIADRENMFAVPIELNREEERKNRAKLRWRRQLIKKPGYYYDGGHRDYVNYKEFDPVNQEIKHEMEHANDRQPQVWDQYEKRENEKKQVINFLISNPKDVHNDLEKDHALNQKLKDESNRRLADTVEEVDDKVKANYKTPYYDPVEKKRRRRRRY